MRNRYVIALIVVILGVAAASELISDFFFPVSSYEPEGLPPLEVGLERGFDYFKDGERVGSHVYRVEGKGEVGGETAYLVRSKTSLEYQNQSFEIDNLYKFNELLNPLAYSLNATIAGEETSVVCVFEGWDVGATVEINNSTVSRDLALAENTVLIDNNMAGHWELLFESFTPQPGTRVSLTMFVPQAVEVYPLELVVEKEPQAVTVGEAQYECTVVREVNRDLVFYLSGGRLIRYENQDQGVVLSIS